MKEENERKKEIEEKAKSPGTDRNENCSKNKSEEVRALYKRDNEILKMVGYEREETYHFGKRNRK